MKSLIIALAIAASGFSAQAASPVIAKYQFHAGFSPRPVSITLNVHENGRVELLTFNHRLSVTPEVKFLAKISLERIEALKKSVTLINAADLKDLDEGEGMCMDAPSSDISVLQNDEEVEISARRGCHKFEMENSGEAQEIKSFIQGLVSLARM